jgi:spermidine synthase
MSASVRRAAAFALVAAGFGAGVAQVLLLRELLVVAYGNELSMGILLACWLLGGAVGSLAGRRLRERPGPYGGAAVHMVRLAVLPGPALVLSLAFARAVPLLLSNLPAVSAHVLGEGSALVDLLRAHVALRPGEVLGIGHMAAVALVAALLPSALDGAQFAVGCKLYGQARGDDRGVGVAYALDAIGHLIGGVLLGWAAVLAFDPFTVAVLAGAVNLAAGAAVACAALGLRGRPLLASAIGIVAATTLLAAYTGDLHRASLHWRWYHQELLANIESIYGNFAITRQEPAGIYLYQNGVFSGASPPLRGTVDEFVHFALLQHPAPRRVLLIGGGILGGLAEVLKHDPETVYYLELDPTVFSMARRWISLDDLRALKDPRVTTRQADGRRFVKHTWRQAQLPPFDAALISLPDPSTAQLNRFYTQEWFGEVQRILAPGGILAWQVPGSESYFSPTLLALSKCLYDTARSVLPSIVAMPGETAVYVGSASRGELTDDWLELEGRLRRRGVEAQYFEALLPNRLDPSMVAAVAETIEQAPPQPLNRDLRPLGYFLDQAHWLTQFHPGSARLLGRIQTLTLADLLLPVAAATVILLCLAPLRPVRTAFVPLSVAATGFVSMALELALLFAFQAVYGYVYHKVGLIIGAFMIGLALGAMLTSRWVAGKAPRTLSAGLAAVQAVGAALAALVGLALPGLWAASGSWLASPAAAALVFPLLTAVVGLGVGVQFPLAGAAWQQGADQTRAAAGLYAADLVGASVGALLAGAVLAPVLGIAGTCEAAAALGAGLALLLALRAWLERQA